jgi:ribosomal protein L16 Arg81 hydroxylase
MSRQFLDNLSFATLLSPVSEEEFLKRHWEKLPLLLRRNDRDYYGDLLTLDDFDHHTAHAQAVKAAEAKSKKSAKYTGNTTSLMHSVRADMRKGMTLVLDRLHEREPKLGLLVRVLEQEFGHRFQTNCYLTPPHGAGFTPHWDNHDVFVLQVLGSKKWQLEMQRRRLPGKTETMTEEEGREIRPGAESFTLEQGDLLYIPRGCVHAAECGDHPSIHITLGVAAFTWDDLLRAAVNGAILADDRRRLALPPGFLRTPRNELVEGLMTALAGLSERDRLADIIDQFKDEVTTQFPLDLTGQVAASIRNPALAADTLVGSRRGIVFTLRRDTDSVRLCYGGETLTFPEFFADALVYALNTRVFAIRDLPGDLADEERIVFVERLLQEGLLMPQAAAATPERKN